MQQELSNISLAIHYADKCNSVEKEILTAFLAKSNTEKIYNNIENEYSVDNFFKKLTDKHSSFVLKNKKKLQNQRKQAIVA